MTTSRASDDLSGFGYGEHLVLWSWRRIAGAPGSAPLVDGELAAACGTDSGEVLATLDVFLHALADSARRPLALAAPGTRTVTADERRVLGLLAAAQADRPALFEAELRWLAQPQQREVLRIAATALAAALSANDLRLALAQPEAPAMCERATATA